MNRKKWGILQPLVWGELKPYTWGYISLEWVLSDTITDFNAQGVRLEQVSSIFSTQTEMIANIVVSNRDYKTTMLNYLPKYEKNSNAFNEILGAYDSEFRTLEQEVDVVDRNMFIETAIEGLTVHEKDLNISNISKLAYDQRREQISSRYRSSFDQTTKDTIKSVASAYTNGEVDVNKTDITGLYEVKFIGKRGIPNNLSGLKEALDIIIPAHLGLEYVFTFTPWVELKTRTWGEVSTKTWNELREWEGVV